MGMRVHVRRVHVRINRRVHVRINRRVHALTSVVIVSSGFLTADLDHYTRKITNDDKQKSHNNKKKQKQPKQTKMRNAYSTRMREWCRRLQQKQ